MEELVLYGMAADNAGEVTGQVKLYIWDAAVPALPLIAQLLLAAVPCHRWIPPLSEEVNVRRSSSRVRNSPLCPSPRDRPGGGGGISGLAVARPGARSPVQNPVAHEVQESQPPSPGGVRHAQACPRCLSRSPKQVDRVLRTPFRQAAFQGFSIPGRLPCLLAVVLGLFAHSGSGLAQTTTGSALNCTEPRPTVKQTMR